MRLRSDEDVASSLVGVSLLLALVLALVACWLVVQAVAVVVRVCRAHPHNRVIRSALGSVAGAVVLVLVTAGRFELVNVLSGVSILALPLVAKAVDFYEDQRLQPEFTRELMLDQVLHQPWWARENRVEA